MNQDLWKHRSDRMKCKTCMWFMPKVAQIDPRGPDMQAPTYDLGRCRRHAPTMSDYPVVFVNDWCGDHKLDEGKLFEMGGMPVKNEFGVRDQETKN